MNESVSSAVSAIGGVQGVVSLLWNIFWFFVTIGLLFLFAVMAAMVAWKLYAWSKTLSVRGIVGQVITEVRGTLGTSAPGAMADSQSQPDPIVLKNQILNAASLLSPSGDAAIAAAMKATNEKEAYKIVAETLAGRVAKGGDA